MMDIVGLAAPFVLAWVPAWVLCEKPGRWRMVLAYVLGALLSLGALVAYAITLGPQGLDYVNKHVLLPFVYPIVAIWLTRTTSKPKQA